MKESTDSQQSSLQYLHHDIHQESNHSSDKLQKNDDTQKTKAIMKQQNKIKKGKNKSLMTDYIEGIDSHSSKNEPSLKTQKTKYYQNKYPKDVLKLYMVSKKSQQSTELVQLQEKIYSQQQIFQEQKEIDEYAKDSSSNNDKTKDKLAQKNLLDLTTIQKEISLDQLNNSILQNIYYFIHQEINNPSDPLGQEFEALCLEQYIVKFCDDWKIQKDKYLNQSIISINQESKHNLRFYEMEFNHFYELIISDISLNINQIQILQMISQYFKLIEQYHQFIQSISFQPTHLQISTIDAKTTQSETIQITFPFIIDQKLFEEKKETILIQSNLVEIIKFFNIYWESIIERFKYYGFYFQLKMKIC